MTIDRRAELERANARFYEGFEALSLDAMDELWEHSDDVWCVHPGSDLIQGWGPVRRSWAAIFANTTYMQFIVTDVCARVDGAGGMVSCTEHILGGANGGQLGDSRAVATNLFTWRDGAWRMVAHHASPVVRTMSGG